MGRRDGGEARVCSLLMRVAAVQFSGRFFHVPGGPDLREGGIECRAAAGDFLAKHLIGKRGFKSGAHVSVTGGLRPCQGARVTAQIR